MGRKSNKKPAISISKENNKFLIHKRKDLTGLVNKLLKLTSNFETTFNLSKCWEDYLEIDTILRQIKKIELSIQNTTAVKSRNSNIEEFIKWLKENGSQFEGEIFV